MTSGRMKQRVRAAALADTPVNWSRLQQLFRNNSRRRTRLFEDVAFGPVVEAMTPAELIEKTDEAFVEAVGGTAGS
jgi:hypothetical protein